MGNKSHPAPSSPASPNEQPETIESRDHACHGGTFNHRRRLLAFLGVFFTASVSLSQAARSQNFVSLVCRPIIQLLYLHRQPTCADVARHCATGSARKRSTRRCSLARGIPFRPFLTLAVHLPFSLPPLLPLGQTPCVARCRRRRPSEKSKRSTAASDLNLDK